MADASQTDVGHHRKAAAAPLGRRLRKPLTAAASLAMHGLLLAGLFSMQPDTPTHFEPEPMVVTLVAPPPPVEIADEPSPKPGDSPSPAPAPTPPAKSKPAPPKPEKLKPTPAKPPPRRLAKLTPPPEIETAPTGESAITMEMVEVSDGALVGATTAGSAGGSGSGDGAGSGAGAGGDCNMPRRLQNALRKDRRVQAAVARAHRGRALMVWNGGWVRYPGQEGDGLASVREAIMWEVGFAPDACRRLPVRGLVVISLGDGPGGGRIVLGNSHWRWTDLLHARRGG